MSPIVKRKGEKFTLPGKYLLFILTIICAGAIILTFNTNIFGGVLNTAVGYVIIPFEKGISSVRRNWFRYVPCFRKMNH